MRISWIYVVCIIYGSVRFTVVSGQTWGWLLPFPFRCIERPVQAYCRLQPNPSTQQQQQQHQQSLIRGVVVFTQRFTCEAAYALQVKVSIAGMPANGNWTYHGLHVHESGDMSGGCESMGPHFNPYQRSHGAQTDPIWRRHVGDLGNVVKDPFGSVQAAIFDEVASLVPGERSIMGRGVVLHEGEDDLGRGNNPESLRTGNAGRRLACCKIMPL